MANYPMPGYATVSNQSQGMSSSTSGSRTAIVPGMLDVYNQLLGANLNRYRDVQNAYQNTQQSLAQQLPGLYQGYGDVERTVLGGLGVLGGGWGVAAPAAQAISDMYRQSLGRAGQQLTNSGLSNSTVLANFQRGAAADAQRSYANLGSQLASTAAGYQSQIGLARQSAVMQGLGMQTGLGQAFGNAMAGQTFSNTAGSLTGGFGDSSSMSNQSAMGNSFNPEPVGGGGSRGGGSGSPTAGQPVSSLFGPFGAYGQAAGTGLSPSSANQYTQYNPYAQQQQPGGSTGGGGGVPARNVGTNTFVPPSQQGGSASIGAGGFRGGTGFGMGTADTYGVPNNPLLTGVGINGLGLEDLYGGYGGNDYYGGEY